MHMFQSSDGRLKTNSHQIKYNAASYVMLHHIYCNMSHTLTYVQVYMQLHALFDKIYTEITCHMALYNA